MLCREPVKVSSDGQRVAPCGQCLPCRINQRRKKVFRLLLEHRFFTGPSSFSSITYADEHLPYIVGSDGAPSWTVSRRTLQLLVKRMRDKWSPGRFRFFGVGEYGTDSGRPHYHMLCYGLSAPELKELTEQCWRTNGELLGGVRTYTASPRLMSYIAGYTAKKLTREEDLRLQPGAFPEFMQQSLKPPIGASERCMDKLEQLCYSYGVVKEISETGDVPRVLRYNRQLWPLDRTMRKMLRKRLGIEDKEDRYVAKGIPAPSWAESDYARIVAARLERRNSAKVHVL